MQYHLIAGGINELSHFWSKNEINTISFFAYIFYFIMDKDVYSVLVVLCWNRRYYLEKAEHFYCKRNSYMKITRIKLLSHNIFLYLYFVLLLCTSISFLTKSLNWLPPVDCLFIVLSFRKHVVQHLKQINKISDFSVKLCKWSRP